MRLTQALHLASNGNDQPLSHIDPSMQPRRQISSREAMRERIAELYRAVVVYARKNNLIVIVKGKKDGI